MQLGSRKALLSANVQSRVVMSSSTKTAVPTWTELAEQIPGSALMPDYKNGPPRVTPSSELTSLRLFGKSEADVEVVLYRDSAYWVGCESRRGRDKASFYSCFPLNANINFLSWFTAFSAHTARE